LKSKLATEQRFFDQFLFARGHSTLTESDPLKQFAYFPDYFKNISSVIGEREGYAILSFNNEKIEIYFDVLLSRISSPFSDVPLGMGSYPCVPNTYADGMVSYFPKNKRIFFDGQININFGYKHPSNSKPLYNMPTIYLHYSDKNKVDEVIKFLSINYNK
jgi:hypothetical protein